jgi:hypothetical protein
MVVFRSFYEKGLGLPTGSFLCGLLHYYGLEVTHLKPNSITQIAIFIHLCEGFLGITPVAEPPELIQIKCTNHHP